ncbi:MAG: kelch repeat-containing protein, partial [Acidimicrobiia bacterium]|nr:kelch repeat-containing protein [Acidimicrobiia bacterium]
TDDGKHVGLDETWIFDAATMAWTEVSPPVSPPPRRFPLMVYDAQSDRIILYGGDTGQSGEPYADTWVFDANTSTWTEMRPSTSPPARVGAAVWYDPTADAMFLFGGAADASSWPALPWMVLGGEELWSYTLESDTWTLHRVAPNPGYRFNLDSGFDPQRGEAIIVGGDFYDENRRFVGWQQEVWTYRDRDR